MCAWTVDCGQKGVKVRVWGVGISSFRELCICPCRQQLLCRGRTLRLPSVCRGGEACEGGLPHWNACHVCSLAAAAPIRARNLCLPAGPHWLSQGSFVLVLVPPVGNSSVWVCVCVCERLFLSRRNHPKPTEVTECPDFSKQYLSCFFYPHALFNFSSVGTRETSIIYLPPTVVRKGTTNPAGHILHKLLILVDSQHPVKKQRHAVQSEGTQRERDLLCICSWFNLIVWTA